MTKVAFFFCLEKKSGGSTCVLTQMKIAKEVDLSVDNVVTKMLQPQIATVLYMGRDRCHNDIRELNTDHTTQNILI